MNELINYAHRGASEYYPENTLVSFYAGWLMGANGIETDVQCTKDGVPVLFHDDDLQRLAGDERKITEMTYEELCSVDIGSHKGSRFAGERVPTLEEFIHHFSGKGLHLALELKQAGIEKQVLDMISNRWPADHLIVTSFIWETLPAVRSIAPEIRTGYLTRRQDEELLAEMKRAGIWQYCPEGKTVTEETMKRFREAGFSIRAWGVSDVSVMRRMLDMGVDGMTVNFPDKLQEALKQR